MFISTHFVDANLVRETAIRVHEESGNSLIVLVGGELRETCQDIVASLQTTEIPFFGGVFPEILLGGEIRADKCLVLPLDIIGAPQVLHAPFSFDKVGRLPDHGAMVESSGRPDVSALVFVSGLTLDISEFTRNLYRKYGVKIRYAGAGTGTFELDPDVPSVFCSEGLFSNAAMVVFIDAELGLAARHGWSRCAGPFVATRTQNRTVHEINWRPAWEVYGEAILELTGEVLTLENFRQHAGRYPIGLSKDGGEDLVREPFIVDGTSIVFSAEVLSQSPFYILEAKLEALRHAATEASELARIDEPCFGLVFECLSRAGYLGKPELLDDLIRIEQASGTAERGVPYVGLIALGEIASNKRGLLEFMNQTVVVANIGQASP